LLYKWQKATHPALAVGDEESESAAMRQLRAENRRLQQERDILKKALTIFMPPTS
jgi:transposase